MRFVSPLLKRVLYPSLASTGYFRRRANRGELCVVTYHGVLPRGYQSKDPALDGSLVTAESLRRQLRLLKSSYNVVSAEDVFQWLERNQKLPARSVLLTCDDGLQNTLSDMVPVLREEGLSCLFFVTGASVGDRSRMLWYEEFYLLLMAAPAGELAFPDLNLTARLDASGERRSLWWNWVKELSRYDALCRTNFLEALRIRCGLPDDWQSAYQHAATRRRFFLLTVEELRQLAANGMFVGAHTLSHPVLAQAPADVAWSEIAESRKALEAALGKPVWAMAYPFGDAASAGVREFEMTERAGYKCAFLNCGGGFPASIPRFAIPRVHVTSDITLGEFEAHISGFHEDLKQRLRPLYSASRRQHVTAVLPMVETAKDPNLHIYNAREVAAYYAAWDYLSPCESLLFETFLKPGMNILDLGVGGGRTTPCLSAIAARYVGVDYAQEMIALRQEKFPRLEFLVADASNLSVFAESTFDAVVIAFNGMDYVIPDEARLRSLQEIHRVLRAAGILIFSSHNPRAILVRPSWNPKKIEEIARSMVGNSTALFLPTKIALTCIRAGMALASSVGATAVRLIRRLPTRAFWRHGEGYLVDSAHGGLLTHCALPDRVSAELARLGYRLLEVLGDDYPRESRPYITDWYYYVFAKAEMPTSQAPCA